MAKKIESTLLNMILSLMLISMFMSAALALVYLKTKVPIEQTGKQKEMNAIKEVVPGFDNNSSVSTQKIEGLTTYTVNSESELLGYAIKTYSEKGFAGQIELMVGFLPDGSISNIIVLQHKETPGLGTKMTDAKFKNQFNGKNPNKFSLKVKKDGGQVDAITAATVSSRAFCDAIQRANIVLQHIIIDLDK